MNLQVFQNAASTCSMHVLLVNSDATTLEGNSPGMFKVAYSYMTSQERAKPASIVKKKVTCFDTQLFSQG